jgi:peptidoglycan L-alanyl-D-glutamate endopeptidase CwlK
MSKTTTAPTPATPQWMSKFEGVHPALVRKVLAVREGMRAIGFDIVPVQGLRSAEYQAALYAQGRTAPGKIVTNCDGTRTKSNHQAKADGLGHAVDVAFVDQNGLPSFDDHWPWKAYGELGKALGLVWGGDFSTLYDAAHLELKAAV